MKNEDIPTAIRAGIFGLATADALGVPHEFESRQHLLEHPVTGMVGFGTYDVPEGTWSDDTGLTLCLMDSIANTDSLDCNDIMSHFQRWLSDGEYTATGEVFDIGHATRKAILMYMSGYDPCKCGGVTEEANGNGSLMRILPLAFYPPGVPLYDTHTIMDQIHTVSSLTHGHEISLISCGIYIHIAKGILENRPIEDAIQLVKKYYESKERFKPWLKLFSPIFDLDKLRKTEISHINSSTYVLTTLEASLWSYLTTDNYRDCVLKAVNLGNDTDTVAAVAGSLAAMKYGYQSIPMDWLKTIQRKTYLEDLINRFTSRVMADQLQ